MTLQPVDTPNSQWDYPVAGNTNMPADNPWVAPSGIPGMITQPTILSAGMQASPGGMNYGQLIRYGYTLFINGIPAQNYTPRLRANKSSSDSNRIGVPYIGRDGDIRIPISIYYAPDTNVNMSNRVVPGNSQSWDNGSGCSCGGK
jgi:hypothetical protein